MYTYGFHRHRAWPVDSKAFPRDVSTLSTAPVDFTDAVLPAGVAVGSNARRWRDARPTRINESGVDEERVEARDEDKLGRIKASTIATKFLLGHRGCTGVEEDRGSS